uniref:palmitoyl-protein hydrolase n=1 Tax=Mus spicilegus TaxID=10103 RepID=A0A8C6HNU9_MUSSI
MAAVPSAVHLPRCVVSPTGRHSASLIFLHGSGHSGQGQREWIKNVLNQDLTFQHIKIIYPTAPSRPYTPLKGGFSNVWFDRFKISMDCPEHLESIDSMCQVLSGLIDEEVKTGIQKSRILIGGFSMGGCMAMHLAYRNHPDVAGVFVLSGFLNKASVVYQCLTLVAVIPQLSRPVGFSYSWVQGGPQTWKKMGGREGEAEDQAKSCQGGGNDNRLSSYYRSNGV